MRSVQLLPLALAAATAAACATASKKPEQTAFQVPRRDLTLQQVGASGAGVASSVELARAPLQRASHLRARHPRRAAGPKQPSKTELAPAAAPAAPTPRLAIRNDSAAGAAASGRTDPHALAPGQTVTVLPVSSGPLSDPSASGPEWTDERAGGTIRIGGPGRGCDPRGGGPDGFRGFR